jgi:hypothetical protein
MQNPRRERLRRKESLKLAGEILAPQGGKERFFASLKMTTKTAVA